MFTENYSNTNASISYKELITRINNIIKESSNEYIYTRLCNIMDEYLSLIKNGVYYKDDKKFFVPYHNEDDKKNGIEYIVNSCAKTTKKIVENYLEGNFKLCNKLSQQWWYQETKKGKKALPITHITPDDIFFRIRLRRNEIKGFKRKDLFHVPFEKRGYISTNRYSVLGHPCLYLGRSIYTCWEEEHRPNLNGFFVSAIKTTQSEIRLLDFRLCRNDFENYWEFRKFLCALPMIIGCSLRVNISDEKFRAEYILPQLILHHIITSQGYKTHWEGIMFTSTQVEEDFGFKLDEPKIADNVAIPIQQNAETGWCSILCNKFSLTEPTNYEYELIKYPIKQSKTDAGIMEDGTIRIQTERSLEEEISPFQLLEMRLKEREFSHIDSKTGL